MHYACIACTTIDSVVRIGKKNYPQVYSEKRKYKIKKKKMPRFIKTESESDLESELESDTELESKSDLESDTE